MLQIKLTLTDIDYEAILKMVYPTLLNKVSQRESRNLLFQLIGELGNDGEAVLLRLMQKLPPESRNQLVCRYLNSYGPTLVEKLNEYLKEDIWGKHFTLDGCEAEWKHDGLTLTVQNVQTDFKSLINLASETQKLEQIANKVAGKGLLGDFAAKAAAKVAEQAVRATNSMASEEWETAGIALLNRDTVRQKLMGVVTKALKAKNIPLTIAGMQIESAASATYSEKEVPNVRNLPEELEDALIKALADFLRETR